MSIKRHPALPVLPALPTLPALPAKPQSRPLCSAVFAARAPFLFPHAQHSMPNTRRSLARSDWEEAGSHDEEGEAALDELHQVPPPPSPLPPAPPVVPGRLAELEALVAALREETVQLAGAVTRQEERACKAEAEREAALASLDEQLLSCAASDAETGASQSALVAAKNENEELESAVRGLVATNETAELKAENAEKRVAAQKIRIRKLEAETERLAAALEARADAMTAAAALRAAKEARNLRRFLAESETSDPDAQIAVVLKVAHPDLDGGREKDAVKRLGAKYAGKGVWSVPPGKDVRPFAYWLY